MYWKTGTFSINYNEKFLISIQFVLLSIVYDFSSKKLRIYQRFNKDRMKKLAYETVLISYKSTLHKLKIVGRK